MARIVMVVICLLMWGCASTSVEENSVAVESLFDDALFDLEGLPALEHEDAIFALSDDAKAFVDETLQTSKNQDDSVSLLAQALFDRTQLGLLYDNSATSVASETFATGQANCLSMTIMTYSMANYAGLSTRFMMVNVPEYWTRREGFSLVNGHVNIEIRTETHTTGSQLAPRAAVIDFDPQEIRRHFTKQSINKQQIIALFYNNRAADSIIKADYNLAYKYLRAAANHDPKLDEIWVNLGVLYRFNGHYKLAESAYRKGIAVNPDNYTLYGNLAILYDRVGRDDLAEILRAKVNRARKYNPFYHFILGEEARSIGEFDTALSHYRRALKLDQSSHEIYFGLGTTLYEMGDISRAKIYLTRAARHATDEEDKARYRGKLSALRTALKQRPTL